ncbi:MAG TPA: hypothetical protein VFZ00_00030 [Solirubrobacter sp.]|jgi:hypothetical protein|nr:hypothetical protein [Solirubrobacter sp.]
MSDAHVIIGGHLRATPDGHVALHLSGSGLATVTLRSARTITPRWLGSGRPRIVRFAMRRVALRPDAVTTVTLKLSKEHLALLHRMQTIRVTIRLETDDGVVTRRTNLHAPAVRRARAARRTPSDAHV